MSAGDGFTAVEYLDSAGYPDGAGFLDEGTVALVDEVTMAAVREVDRPSTDAELDIEVHRIDDEHVYSATIGGRELASLRYDEVDDRTVVLTMTVLPEFRGRGIADELIANALDDIRDHGRRVTVRCPVVAAFMAGNPQFSDLLDEGRPYT
ncbi:GNAT family N-acetyltransferase [Agromyces sp. NPDC055520]